MVYVLEIPLRVPLRESDLEKKVEERRSADRRDLTMSKYDKAAIDEEDVKSLLHGVEGEKVLKFTTKIIDFSRNTVSNSKQ